MAQELGRNSRNHLRVLFSVGVTAGLTDGQLLERFATARGDAAELAFAALVERHGPMVLRACRGVLRDDHEAMDAFQATFLILVRKSGTLWVQDSLAPWLHRVACRAAGQARAAATRRRILEQRASERLAGLPADGVRGDLSAILHEEIDRLPDRYRVPVVLCDLEGHTHEEAARHLGCPTGTVKSRLARGRERLRGRLIRRGLAPSALLTGPGLTAKAAPASLPDVLAGSTIQAAAHMAAGGVTTAGVVPASVAALTEGVLKMMFQAKLKLIAAGTLVALGLAIGVGALAQQAAEDRPPDATARPAPKPASVPDGNRGWTRSLPNGATVEVVGISPQRPGPRSWWGPDGSPLAQPPCDPPPRMKPSSTPNQTICAIVVRVTDLAQGARFHWRIPECLGGLKASQLQREGKPAPDLSAEVAVFSGRPPTCTVQFEVAAGPWQTVQTSHGEMFANGSGNGPSYVFGKATATRTGTILTVTHDIQDVDVRLVAVDRDGKEHTPGRTSEGGAKNFSQLEAIFDISPEAIREYRLQTRPYERAEIKDVPLKLAAAP